MKKEAPMAWYRHKKSLIASDYAVNDRIVVGPMATVFS